MMSTHLSTEVETNTNCVGRVVLTVLFCLAAILQSGLRDISKLPDYNDTPVYQAKYNQLLITPWGSVFDDFTIFSSEYDVRDSGYEVFMKLTQLVSHKFIFFMFITAILFIVPFGLLVNRYAKSYLGIVLSFAIYFSIFTTIVNSFMRQAIALGVVLFSTKYVVKRDWKSFFLLALFNLTIHSSSVIAIPLYFLPRLSDSRKWIVLSLFLLPVLFYFHTTLFSFFLRGSVYSSYMETEAVSPINYMLLLSAIVLLALVFFQKIKSINGFELFIGGVIGVVLLMPLVFMGNAILRISYYYVVLLIPFVSVVIDSIRINPSIRLLVYLVSISFFLYLSFT